MRPVQQQGGPVGPPHPTTLKGSKIMKFISKYLGRILLLSILTIVTLAAGSLIAYAIAHKFIPPNDPFWTDARCALGLPTQQDIKCIQIEIDAAIQRGKEIEAKLNADIAAQTAAKDAAERAAAGNDMVFESGDAHNGKTLVVGALYSDSAARTGLLVAYCWAIEDRGGLDPRVPLARRQADGRIVPLPVDAAGMANFNWNAADLETARNLCPWSKVS